MHSYLKLLFGFFLMLVYFDLAAQDWVTKMENGEPLPAIQASFEEYFEGIPFEKGKGWRQFKRWEYMMEGRVDENGNLPGQEVSKSLITAMNSRGQNLKGSGYANWTSEGPFTVPINGYGAGRLNAIAFHPSNPNIIWVGSPSGGLWKSTNGGSSWSTATDYLAVIGIADILISSNNPDIMYIATGDPNGNDTYSLGILKSTDGGATWNTTNLLWTPNSLRQIYKLLMVPGNDNMLLAATNLGIYKSVDAGQNWTLKKSGSYRDMEFKPGDPAIVYSVTTGRLFISTDTGNTFNLSNAFSSATNTSRLSLAVTANNANYIYILAVRAADNGFEGIYQSTDAAATFTLRASSPNLLGWKVDGSDSGGQGWYDLSLAVSPVNKDLILVGGVNIWRSLNGGASWTIVAHWTGSQGKPLVHADIHEIDFHPGGSKVYACSDGGLSVSSNSGSTWTDLHDGLSIGQIYRIGVSQSNPGLVISGWQDNGSSLLLQNNTWKKALGGDGMECLIDYVNPNYMYGSMYNGALFRSVDGGNNWIDIGDEITEAGAWVTPFDMDPVNPAKLYAGYINVWRSTNRGGSWNKISNFSGTSTLRSLAIAPSNTQYIYTATLSTLYKSTDGGNTWTNITSGLQNGDITDIAVSSHNPNHLFVTKSGYYIGKKVYRSRDGGASWQNYSGSLPNLPANTIVYENGKADAIYVGMDVGIYYRDSLMVDWVPYNDNLPNVIIQDLEILYADHKLMAGTYGRGIWQTDTWDWINAVVENPGRGLFKLKVYPNPASETLSIKPVYEIHSPCRIIITDLTGRIIYQETVSNLLKEHQFNVSRVSAGLYHLTISSDPGNFSTPLVISR